MSWPSDARGRGEKDFFILLGSDCFGSLGLNSVSEFNVLEFVYMCLQKLCHTQSEQGFLLLRSLFYNLKIEARVFDLPLETALLCMPLMIK